jgi:hypothetical protein
MKYVLGYGLSNTIGIPAGVDQRVVKANYNWYWYTGVRFINRNRSVS